MGHMGGGTCSMKNHTLFHQDCDSGNGDVSSGYGFKNSHTLSKCEESSTFKEMHVDVEKGDGDVISGYEFLNSQTFPQCED